MITNKLSPLNQWHLSNNAIMTSVAGWVMPLKYQEDSKLEHLSVRRDSGLFDLSHMSKFFCCGADNIKKLSSKTTVDIDSLKIGRCKYGFVLNEQGGILDDLVFYKLSSDKCMIVGNSFCREQDFKIFNSESNSSVVVSDVTENYAKIDLQGPKTFEVLTRIFPEIPWKRLPYFGFTEVSFEGSQLIASRTGYTGELGVELFVPSEIAFKVWEPLISSKLVCPAGLEARETLRLEAGLPLNSLDLTPSITPAEAGFGGLLTSNQHYTGKLYANQVKQKLVSLVLDEIICPKPNSLITLNNNKIGFITSSIISPSLNCSLAFAYIDIHHAKNDLVITVNSENHFIQAKIIPTPAYSKGTARGTIL